MRLSEFIPTRDQLNFVQGIEGKLLQRQRLEVMSAIIAVMGGLLQVFISIVKDFEISTIISAISVFFSYIIDLVSLNFDSLQNYEPVYELAGIAILASGIGFYLLLKRTKFLLRESEEPFRYTFWINQFKEVQSKTDEDNKKFKDNLLSDFLHIDLTERLSERVGRLSLLDDSNFEDETKKHLHSHINIEGEYALRKNRENKLRVHVISRIRIGSPSQPSNLTYAINYPLNQTFESDNSQLELAISDYEDIVERVYSSVATEIYKQIKKDLEDKISMFPTRYRRAVALFHEANDFARSNTVDAYDHAIELYREAIRYFNISFRTKMQLLVLKLPLLWRLSIRFHHNWARTIIEYSKCLIYRRLLSTLSGRLANPLFEIPDELSKVINRLNEIHHKMADIRLEAKVFFPKIISPDTPENKHTSYRFRATMAHLNFKKDSLTRHLLLKTAQSAFKRQKEILFEANVVAALAYNYMDAIEKAKVFLKNAKAIAPSYSKENVLFMITSALLESDIEEKTSLLRHATEKAPNFEIGQFLFSKNLEMLLRTQNQIDKERAKNVIEQYDKVTKINPGNIAALNSQGYLNWLIYNLEEAEKKFLRGSEVKSIVQYTFIGELSYGLARVAAQKGAFNRCYNYFEEAISAEPSVGAYSEFSSDKTVTSYYSYIGPTMKKCFENYKQQVERKVEALIYGFCTSDIKNPDNITSALSNPEENTLAEYLAEKLSAETKKILQPNGKQSSAADRAEALAKSFTELIADEHFLNESQISSIQLKQNIRKLINQRQNGGDSVHLNRMIIEQTFPKAIRNYTDSESENRFLTDVEGKPLAENTINVVRSFVLNDYANALLNYYHRFGNNRHIENAIQLYCEAKDLNPSYKVVYLNLYNAYSWQGNQQKARECLQEGEKYFTTWEAGQMAFLSSEAENTQYMIDKLKLDLNNKSTQALSFSDNTQTMLSTNLKEEKVRHNSAGVLDYGKNDSKSVSKKEKNDLKNEIVDLRESLEKEKRKRRSKIYSKLESIMAQGNLGSLFEGLQIDHHGNGVDKFCEYKFNISKDKLNENDIQALYIWAQILSYNSDDEKALVATKKLCELIKYYYPDHFDATCILHKLFFSFHKNDVKPFSLKEDELQNLHSFLELLTHNEDPVSKVLIKYMKADKTLETVIQNAQNNTASLRDQSEQVVKDVINAVNKFIEDGNSIDWKDRTDQLSKRTANLLNLDLKGKDLMGLKRRLLEELYPGSIETKSIKTYREDIRKMIEFWIKQKDAAFAAFCWALDYSTFTFPEYKKLIKDATLKLNTTEENFLDQETLFAQIAGQYKQWEDWQNAEKAYLEAVKLNPSNSGYYNHIGVTHYQQEDYKGAADYFKLAIDSNPEIALYYENIGNSFIEFEEWDKAEEAYKQAIEIEPENAAYDNRIGLLHYKQGNYKDAIPHFNNASKKQKDEPLYLENVGDAYRELGEWKQAEKKYLEAQKLDIEKSGYDNKIGILYYRQHNYEKALKFFISASKKNTSNPVYFSNIGDAYIGLFEYDKALTAFNNALKLNPENAEYLNKVGIVYYRKGKYTDAITYFEHAAEINPEVSLYLENIGDSHLELKQWEKAEQAFKKALSVNAASDYAVNQIGIVYYLQQQYEKAIEYFFRASELNRDVPVYINNIADSYNNLGNYDKAEKFRQQAMQVGNS